MIQTVSTKFTGPIPGINRKPNIALNPVKADYPRVRYWYQEPWNALRKGAYTKEQATSTYSAFMENEFRNAVSDAARCGIRSDFSSYFTECYLKTEKIPNGYGGTAFGEKESFRIAMEGKYPWLRLCDGNWKFKQVWTHSLAGWKSAKLPRLPKLSNEGPATDQEVLNVSSEEDNRREPRVILKPPTSSSSGGVK